MTASTTPNFRRVLANFIAKRDRAGAARWAREAEKALILWPESPLSEELRAGLRLLRKHGLGDPATCECCGFTPLVSIHIKNGHVVGPECAKPRHPFPCRGGRRSK